MMNVDPHELLREIVSIIERAESENRDLSPAEDIWCGMLLGLHEEQFGAWPPSRAPFLFEFSDEHLDLAISILRLKCRWQSGFWPALAVSTGIPDVPSVADANTTPFRRLQSELDFWTIGQSAESCQLVR
jgi:hypothetical protein